ncbi:helix-turn-helix transcriptional regulator [Dehalobacter sp. DCM]|uniref:helix-turn-helix transcriptional regulator n=1 Tax=Dehalobacter sp. DCM TaxID=2907827 RepID=UPI0030815422|nr:helix-turn-helix transcriptional regulator [Dehalobacter sp. DCM]
MKNNEFDLIDDINKCSCLGYNLDKLIQPKILITLNRQDEPLHGYRIIELLNENFFCNNHVDSTGIYRALKTLEEHNILGFEWDTTGTGPAKKTYWLTEAGKKCLANWIKTLKEYQKNICQIIDTFELSNSRL